MSPAPTFAELRDRAGFQARARPLVRARPAARTVLVVAMILAFFAVCVAVGFFGGFDEPTARAARTARLRGWAWIPALHAAALLGGGLLFGFPARRTWRVGAALLLVGMAAPPATLVVLLVASPPADGLGAAVAATAGLSALPVVGLVALAIETRRRLRWDRFR